MQGNFFIEMQNQGLSEEKRINPLLKRISDETGIETIATNDVQESLLCCWIFSMR